MVLKRTNPEVSINNTLVSLKSLSVSANNTSIDVNSTPVSLNSTLVYRHNSTSVCPNTVTLVIADTDGIARVRNTVSQFQSNLYRWGSEFCP